MKWIDLNHVIKYSLPKLHAKFIEICDKLSKFVKFFYDELEGVLRVVSQVQDANYDPGYRITVLSAPLHSTECSSSFPLYLSVQN